MPDFSDPSNFVDDITEEELLTDILNVKPNANTGMENIVIVDGLPMVPPERLDKLKAVVRKQIVQNTKCDPADIVNEIYPVDENNVSKGFAFYEFDDKNPELAQKLKKTLDNYKFDKQHTLSVDLFVDFDEYANYSDEDWQEPQARPFKNAGNLRYWLENEDCYDQYILIWGSHTGTEEAAVYANAPVEPQCLEQRQHWTDRFAVWSPLGSYLATFHQKGLALWGAKEFKQISRFVHQGVFAASFSPKERYILTIRSKPEHLPVDEQCLILWDVVTSAMKKTFPWSEREPPSPQFLKWSPDENFFATLSKDSINIYDTDTFTRNQVKTPGVADFSFSPTQNFLAYWVRESTDVPARLGLYELQPGKAMMEARTKQLFSVTNCELAWQKNGEYLAVKVYRYKHAKKKPVGGNYDYLGQFFNLEIFTLTNRKEIPVESIEVRDNIVDLAWEPNGNKLVVLTMAEAVTSVSFYTGRQGAKFELIKKIQLRHKLDKIAWSPMGQFLALHTAAGGSVGYLVFIDTSDLSILADVEHFLLSEVQWDPTGRYLTAITFGNNKRDNGYTLYSFQGRYVRNEKVDGLSFFSWRPRPPTLLNEEDLKKIKKNLKKYGAEFDMKDKLLLTKASKEVSERRRRQMDDFVALISRKQRAFEQARHKRLELRGGLDTEALDAHPDELMEEKLEIMVGIKEIEVA